MATKKQKKAHELTDEETMKKLFHPKIVKHLKQVAHKARKKK